MSKKMQIDIKTTGANKARGDIKGLDSSIKNTVATMLTATAAVYALKKAFDISIQVKNAARDATETRNKFLVVFEDVSKKAKSTAIDLADSYGMASSTAMTLLGDTGDILVGFGFAEDAALDLSRQVNELAVDLASFTNYAGGASGASKALTKAMLGETESAKSLGIVLRQGTREFKNSVKAMQESEGLTYNQAMAQTLLQDAIKQSGKAMGDFARTQHELANQERILEENFKELQEELGSKLLPVFENLTVAMNEGVTEAIKNMNAEIDTEQMKDLTEDFKMLGKQMGEVVTILITSINLFNKYKEIFYALNPALGITKKVLQGVWEGLKKINDMYSINKETLEEIEIASIGIYDNMLDAYDKELEIIKESNKEKKKSIGIYAEIKAMKQAEIDAIEAKAKAENDSIKAYETWHNKMLEGIDASERLEEWTLKVVAAAKEGDDQAVKIAESLGIELDQINKLTRGYKLLFEAKGLEDIKQIKPPEEEPTAPFWDMWIETVEDDATVALEGFYAEWAELQAEQQAMYAQASQFMGNVLYEAMGGQFDNIEEMFINMVKRMIAEFAVFLILTGLGAPASATGGGGILAGLFGMKEGGTVHNKNGKIVKAQSGLNSFMVPTGYPNDSFPIMVQSGERVDVTPAGQVGNQDKLLEKLIIATRENTDAVRQIKLYIGDDEFYEGYHRGQSKSGEF